uniref:Uncharacterized protein n=1 Tax=Arundo donax TaxID=35708 RepID=A0A0A9CQ93_ARUDO
MTHDVVEGVALLQVLKQCYFCPETNVLLLDQDHERSLMVQCLPLYYLMYHLQVTSDLES